MSFITIDRHGLFLRIGRGEVYLTFSRPLPGERRAFLDRWADPVASNTEARLGRLWVTFSRSHAAS